MSSLLLVFFLFIAWAHAQHYEPVNPQKDRLEFQGYSIHLMPAMHGTYGYYIVKGKQMVLFQSRNPFTGSPIGLTKKEDVYKVSQWQIKNLESRPVSRMVPTHQQHIPSFAKLTPSLQQRLQQMPTIERPHEAQLLLRTRVPLKVAEELHINLNNH